MNQCIYTKEAFEKADAEHILQNSLGARWASDAILSNHAQHRFGNTIDVALADGLKEFRNLLGHPGGRGNPGPSLTNISGSEGTKFIVHPGGLPSVAEPVVKTTLLQDGRHQVQFTLGDVRQLGWAVAKLKEIHPTANIAIEDLHSQITEEHRYVSEKLNLRSSLGGDEFFRGALKAAFNLLGVSNANIALQDAFDDVRKFILSGDGECKNFVRWLNLPDAINAPKIGEFDQFVAIYAKDRYVDGYIQFYGDLGFSLRLTDCYEGPDFQFGYLVDPTRGTTPAEQRNPSFDRELLPAFESGSELPVDTVLAGMSTRYSRILERYYRRADEDNVSRIVDEVLLPHIGQAFSKEMIGELSQKTAEYFLHRLSWRRPPQ